MPDIEDHPYRAFGAKIKHFRQQWKQSVSDVSGTLEIDEIFLKDMESGKVLPNENQLDMIINHFLLTNEQADELRSLTQMQNDQNAENLIGGVEDMLMKQLVMYMPVDQRVIYTDGMNVTVNRHGVVLQFTQNTGANEKTKSNIVCQVGMSREHAEKVVQVLKKTLSEHDKNHKPKYLPPKGQNKNKPKTI
ncbi:MAG: hypothetical protein WD885_03380 [Candidatus Saccharimonadales bacterium]